MWVKPPLQKRDVLYRENNKQTINGENQETGLPIWSKGRRAEYRM